MAKSVTGSYKKSAVWQYFAEVEGKLRSRCLLCLKEYSFSSKAGPSVSNLRKHLLRRHKSEAASLEESRNQEHRFNCVELATTRVEGNLNVTEYSGLQETSRGGSSERSEFDEKPLDIIDEQKPIIRDSNFKNQRSLWSRVWQFFKPPEDHEDPNTALCMICNKRIKSSGGVSNLRIHLRRMHPNDGRNRKFFGTKRLRIKRSPVWSHFIRNENGHLECKICMKKFACNSYSSNLRKHVLLHESNPIPNSMNENSSSDMQLYEPEEDQEDQGIQEAFTEIDQCSESTELNSFSKEETEYAIEFQHETLEEKKPSDSDECKAFGLLVETQLQLLKTPARQKLKRIILEGILDVQANLTC